MEGCGARVKLEESRGGVRSQARSLRFAEVRGKSSIAVYCEVLYQSALRKKGVRTRRNDVKNQFDREVQADIDGGRSWTSGPQARKGVFMWRKKDPN